MPSKPRYVFGGEVTRDEFVEVRARIIPDWKKRCKQVPAGVLLRTLHAAVPHRLAFEIDRLRGYDYEAGEHGFTYAIQL